MEFLLVRVSIWLAMASWFASTILRARAQRLRAANAHARIDSSHPSGSSHVAKSETDSAAQLAPDLADRLSSITPWIDLLGSLLLIAHIVAAYGWVHEWSHARAIEVTAQESFAVTGVRAGWGVYVNFFFAASWLVVSLLSLQGIRLSSAIQIGYFAFQLAIVISATIVFEAGPVRWAAALGLILLALVRFWPTARSSSGDRPRDSAPL